MKLADSGIDWRIPGILGVASLIGAATGPAGTEWLRFDRAAIADGQVWRLVTGHFVHLGWRHLLLNLAGLVLVWLLVGSRLSARQWLLTVAICVAGVSGGLWYLDKGLEWYVGLSGVLHGLLFAGLIMGMSERAGDAIAVSVALVAKLAYEQMAGPLPGSQGAAGGLVVVNAHLYGFIAGGLAGLLIRRKVQKSATTA